MTFEYSLKKYFGQRERCFIKIKRYTEKVAHGFLQYQAVNLSLNKDISMKKILLVAVLFGLNMVLTLPASASSDHEKNNVSTNDSPPPPANQPPPPPPPPQS